MAAENDLTLDDFRKQLNQLDKMGDGVFACMPGISLQEGRERKDTIPRIRRMIDAMTEAERREPDGIDLGQRQRIAEQSGSDPEEVERFLEQFKQCRTMMREMVHTSVWQRIKLPCGLERGSEREEKG